MTSETAGPYAVTGPCEVPTYKPVCIYCSTGAYALTASVTAYAPVVYGPVSGCSKCIQAEDILLCKLRARAEAQAENVQATPPLCTLLCSRRGFAVNFFNDPYRTDDGEEATDFAAFTTSCNLCRRVSIT